MPEGLEDPEIDTAAVETHGLLLSLAGHVDDELLGWCRELVAVGEGDYALELVTASVQADRVRLPAAVHANLLNAAGRRRVIGRGDPFPPADPSPRMVHRFAADPTECGFPPRPEGSAPEDALQAVPERLLRGCQLWLTWRLTPAGGAPGPLPHPVVLIETLDGVGTEVLAYQVAEVLSRAGVFASVEVFSSERELGDYHRAALSQALALVDSDEIEDPEATAVRSGPIEAVQPSPHPRPQPHRDAGSVAAREVPAGRDGESSPAREAGPSSQNGQNRDGGPRRLPENGTPRPTPQDGPRRPPMHPVDRVITARSSAPRRPRPDRQPGSLDDVAAGLNFERGNAGYPVEHDAGYQVEHDAEEPMEPDAGDEQAPTDRRQSRDAPWSASEPPEPAGKAGPHGKSGLSGRSGPAGRPGTAGSARDKQPAPDEDRPASSSPSAAPGERRAGRPTPLPKRRPTDGAGEQSPNELSDVEQRLLRQLHEELAAREDRSMPVLPEADKPPRIFRSANGGRKRPPRPGPAER